MPRTARNALRSSPESKNNVKRILDERPSPAVVAAAKRAMSMQCATCPSLAPCPVCPRGQYCQLQVPPSCSQCPANACVPIPNYNHGPSAGSIGGGVGGVLLAFALAAVLFWFWRRRHRRAKEALRRARADAKLRVASAEKFRPGGGQGGAIAAIKAASSEKGVKMSDRADSAVQSSVMDEDEDDENEEENEADVEWTELREDGLTTYRNKPGQDGLVDQDTDALKRRSLGAATHLSRITEGAEEDEEGGESGEGRYRKSRQLRETILEEAETTVSGGAEGARGHSSSASIGSEQNRTRSRRSHIGKDLSNPFADWAEIGSMLSSTSTTGPGSTEGSTAVCSSALEHGKWSLHTSLEPPSRVHRPVGAPLVDLQGKPKSAGFASLSSGIRSPASPTREVLSPISPQLSTSSSAPSRPMRKPDLNLRLEDGSEPGKVGDDLRKHRTTSPKSPSTPQFDTRRTTVEIEASEIDDFPTELAKSDVYANKYGNRADNNKRNSVLTTGTTGTMDTLGTFEYVLSAPQIVTPLAADGAKRVELKQGKAHLVRSLSAIRKEQEEQRARRKAQDLLDGASVTGSEISSRSENPFLDPQGASSNFGRASPTNTFGGRPDSIGDNASINLVLPFSHKGARPQSGMSEASLPFVDRPMREPSDRSPTDAHPRESMATIMSAHINMSTGNYRPSMSSELDVPRAMRTAAAQRSSNASSMQPYAHGNNIRRQSGTSIGGLSVFDEIPFHIAQENDEVDSPHVEIAMPDETQSKVETVRQRSVGSSSSVANSTVTVEIVPAAHQDVVSDESNAIRATQSPLLLSLDVEQGETIGRDAQPRNSPFHDDNAKPGSILSSNASTLERDFDVRRSSIPVSLADEPEELHTELEHVVSSELDGRSSALDGKVRQPSRLGINSDFDQIRLRHELDNYPFAHD